MIEQEHSTPEFEGVRRPILTWKESLVVADARRTQWQEKRPYTESAEVTLDTGGPVTIFGMGDWHYGSVYCDTDTLRRDLNAIAATPNAYMVLMSNLIDNGNPSQFPDSMLANSMTPHDQVKAINDLVKGLDEKGKIIGAVKSPCHEGWLWKKSGVDINELLFEDTTFPLLDNGGKLTVHLPGQDYKGYLFHQTGPFNSNFNKSHNVQQMQRLLLRGDADFVMAAHNHVGEAMQTYYGVGSRRTDVAYLRTGSYKGNVSGDPVVTPDMWNRDQRGSDGEPGAESIMLFPRKRVMQTFLRPEQALEFHKAMYTMAGLEAAGIIGRVNEIIDGVTVFEGK